MDAWWAKDASEAPGAESRLRAVAYYRHSAQDRQENSIPLQREQVQKWAAEQGIEIIHEFADHGKSGLSAEHRDAFNDMLENWVQKRDDFRYVLALDVSRWGRFQDTDLSATYSAQCTRHGKSVVYTSLGLPKKDDPFHSMVVGFERYRAAQYSRELSDKVFRGAARIAGQGFRAGGSPPYGLHRILVDEARLPVQILKPSQRKSIQNQRVTLAPGDPKEVAVVLRIFEECAYQNLSPEGIAAGLNRDGIPSAGGTAWHPTTVKDMLENEHYTGTMVYNKISSKLKAGYKKNPRDQWIRVRSAFKGIIPRQLFDQVQAILLKRELRCSSESQLEQLKILYERCGTLKYGMFESNRDAVSRNCCRTSFGSLGAAFQKFYPEVIESVKRTVRAELATLFERVEDYADFIILDRRLSVLIQPSVPIPYGYGFYWPFLPDPREVVDITLGVPVSGSLRWSILGYLAFPRLLMRCHPIRLFGASDWRVELFGHKGLEFLQNLLSIGGAYGPQRPASHEGSPV